MPRPKFFSTFMHITLTLACVYLARVNMGLEIAYGWFLFLNIIVLLSFGLDKLSAKMQWRRTPEATFLALGLFGAFPAILLGRKLFKHKTTKRKFIVPMWGLFIVQLVLATAYLEHVAVKRDKVLAPFFFTQEAEAPEQTETSAQ